jgi:hypothetical protein
LETKSAYVFSVKVTPVTDNSSALAIGDSSVLTNGAITSVNDAGIASVVHSYGAEDADAYADADAGTNGQSDNTSDNALLIRSIA